MQRPAVPEAVAEEGGGAGGRSPTAGLVALVLAVAVAVGGSLGYRHWALVRLERYAHALATKPLLAKTQDLILQEAALRDPRLLMVFGTSELYCCAGGFNAPQLFWHEPTGFAVYAAGVPVTGDLFFAETFAALGHALKGKKVVLSDSPWYSSLDGVGQPAYDHTFSPEIAEVFAFDSPVSLSLRQAIARRMLAYPKSLQGRPLLTAALRDLAGGTAADLLRYYLLDPVGRLTAWVAQVRGAYDAVKFVRSHPALRRPVRDRPQVLHWRRLLRRADRVSAKLTSNNPFGVLRHQWQACGDIEPSGPWCRRALRLYREHRTNRNGGLFPYPVSWVKNTLTSPAWTDLRLALDVLRQMGARPFAYLIPLQGQYDDHTYLSASARQILYLHYAAITSQEGVLSTTFSHHDEDRYFVDSFGHFNARGWVIVDYTLYLFWNDALGPLRSHLAAGGSGWPLTGGWLSCVLAHACRP